MGSLSKEFYEQKHSLETSYDDPVVSDFYFIGYPLESKIDTQICNITFLNHELTGDYI